MSSSSARARRRAAAGRAMTTDDRALYDAMLARGVPAPLTRCVHCNRVRMVETLAVFEQMELESGAFLAGGLRPLRAYLQQDDFVGFCWRCHCLCDARQHG